MCARVCVPGSERVLQSGRAWFLLQDFNARALAGEEGKSGEIGSVHLLRNVILISRAVIEGARKVYMRNEPFKEEISV